MSFEERQMWVGLLLGLVGVAGYWIAIIVMVQSGPLTETAWGPAMLWTLGLGGGAYGVFELVSRARRRGQRVSDERDAQINQFGEFTGRGLLDLAVLATIIMLALGTDTFWCATVLFTGGFLASVITAGAKIAAYREGIPS